MNWKTAASAVVGAVLLNACGDSSGSEVTRTGIYRLEMVTESDTCSPKRVSGDLGPMMIKDMSDHFALYYFEGEGTETTWSMSLGEVPKTEPYEFDYSPKSDCPESRRVGSLMLLQTGDSTKFRFQERYSGLATCHYEPDTYYGLPDADCEASLLLSYQLVDVCEAPCRIESRSFLPPSSRRTEFYCDCG